jgi:hypothetical protein
LKVETHIHFCNHLLLEQTCEEEEILDEEKNKKSGNFVEND